MCHPRRSCLQGHHVPWHVATRVRGPKMHGIKPLPRQYCISWKRSQQVLVGLAPSLALGARMTSSMWPGRPPASRCWNHAQPLVNPRRGTTSTPTLEDLLPAVCKAGWSGTPHTLLLPSVRGCEWGSNTLSDALYFFPNNMSLKGWVAEVTSSAFNAVVGLGSILPIVVNNSRLALGPI